MPRETYVTPHWVWNALYAVEPSLNQAWDCAPLDADFDFMDCSDIPSSGSSIATNPPYEKAEEFVCHALKLTKRTQGKVAMLLPLAFDAAKSRFDLFRDCSAFKSKHTITRRIRWANLEQKTAGPSMNHAWFVWDWGHRGPPTMGWLP